MRKNKFLYLFISLGIAAAIGSCQGLPTFPNAPSISFVSIEYVEGSDNPASPVFRIDSLNLTVYFQDGDGDLGLRSDETFPPFHPFDYVVDGNGNRIRFGSRPGLPPFSCVDYIRLEDTAARRIDTFQIRLNQNHNNIFVNFFRKVGGNYVEYDWRSIDQFLCAPNFDSRFPIIRENVSRELPIEGELTYAMTSRAFRSVMRNDTFKITVSIQDRALNRSNTVESPDFTLEMVRKED